MKKSIWLAIIGAAALAGCQSEVMQQREYVPAPREDVGPAESAPAQVGDATANAGPEVTPIQSRQDVRQPAEQPLQPMTQSFNDVGVSEDAPTIGKDGKNVGKTDAGTGAPKEYVLKKGETLSHVAKKFRVPLKALLKANNLTEASAKRVRAGRKIAIPEGNFAARRSKGAKNAGTAGPGEYILNDGETLSHVAHKFKVPLKALLKANNLTEESAKRVRAGSRIVIPGKGGAADGKPVRTASAGGSRGKTAARGGEQAARPAAPEKPKGIEVDGGYAVEVPRNMSVGEFAKINNVSVEQLRELNPNMPEKTLKKNNVYVVPKN